ncbi:MAG: hypothetical protein RR836_21865 [Aeromonas sp.]|uniref:hypothetical protein n=1 Tax=Aeromonas sp. TaxID=647 RepID=UPI002FC6CA1E
MNRSQDDTEQMPGTTSILKLMCKIRGINRDMGIREITEGKNSKLVAGAGFEPTTFGL